jgi:hypothetical protein
MNGGLPPQPTFRSIFGGIALLVILILAFLNIDKIFKYIGATLTFIPSQLGLFKVVSRNEVMPVDIHSTPTSITFTKPGRYLLYTDDYDLLVVNDAIIAANIKPWINIQSESGEPVQVSLIKRGMAIYDTPLARGRPVAGFEIVFPGVYSLAHPRKPVNIYIVPDYLSGKEGKITFFICLEIVIVVLAIWFFTRRRRTEKNSPISLPQRPWH